MQAAPVIKRIPFTHQGKSYHVAVTYANGRLEAKAYHEKSGMPANNVKASADIDTATDLQTILGLDAVEMIVNEAKKSVTDYDPKKEIEGYFNRQNGDVPIKSLTEYFSRVPSFSEEQIRDAVKELMAGGIIEEITTPKNGIHYRKARA
jgi:hypothetical protein